MKKGSVRGIVAGAMLGAAAATAIGMMNRQTQAKIKHFATTGGQKLVEKASVLWGK